MATWHAAQWKWTLLSRLVHDAGGSLDRLAFLPPVLADGNEWIFGASTRKGKMTL
jgi:hypothetical protein